MLAHALRFAEHQDNVTYDIVLMPQLPLPKGLAYLDTVSLLTGEGYTCMDGVPNRPKSTPFETTFVFLLEKLSITFEGEKIIVRQQLEPFFIETALHTPLIVIFFLRAKL